VAVGYSGSPTNIEKYAAKGEKAFYEEELIQI
jgi:hypothetical protein